MPDLMSNFNQILVNAFAIAVFTVELDIHFELSVITEEGCTA